MRDIKSESNAELLEKIRVLTCRYLVAQTDLDVNRQRQAEKILVDECNLAGNNTARLQLLYPAQAGGGGEPGS